MGMDELIKFGTKNSLTLPTLVDKFFNSLGDENDEPNYRYTDPFMRNIVRNSIKSGRCNAFNQLCKCENSNDVFNTISKKLNVNGNTCDLQETFFGFLSKYEKLHAKEINSKCEDCRDINQEKKNWLN